MIKKKRSYLDLLKLTLVILLIGASLTACSQPEKEDVQEIQEFEEEEVIGVEEIEEEEEENEKEKIAEIYEGILEEIEDYDFDEIEEEDVESVEYNYSIVNMSEKNEAQMLVAKDNGYGIEYIRVFSYDLEEEKIIAPDTILTIGVGGGGFRGGLNQLEDKASLEYIGFMSGTGKGEIIHIKIEESDLIQDLLWEGSIDDLSEDRNLLVIDWVPIRDLSKLKQLAEGEENFNKEIQEVANEKDKASSENGDLKDLIEKEKKEGKVVLEGIIKKMTYQEILELKNDSDPNPEYSDPNEEFYIFLLAEPQEIAFQSGDGGGSSKRIVEMIKINEVDGITKHLGENINLSLDPNKTYWPTDTSLPLGQPSTSVFEVIE